MRKWLRTTGRNQVSNALLQPEQKEAPPLVLSDNFEKLYQQTLTTKTTVLMQWLRGWTTTFSRAPVFTKYPLQPLGINLEVTGTFTFLMLRVTS